MTCTTGTAMEDAAQVTDLALTHCREARNQYRALKEAGLADAMQKAATIIDGVLNKLRERHGVCPAIETVEEW